MRRSPPPNGPRGPGGGGAKRAIRMAKFCFVIHPLSFEDVVRYEPGAAGKGKPIIAKILEWKPAWNAAHVTGGRTPDGRETEGWFVAAGVLPEKVGHVRRGRGCGPRRRPRRRHHRQRTFADPGDDGQLAHHRRRRAKPVPRRGRDGD